MHKERHDAVQNESCITKELAKDTHKNGDVLD